MKVKDFLPSVKAHKGIYYNLNEQSKREFQNLYKYLLKHKEKDTDSIAPYIHFKNIKHPYGTFLYKLERMKIISQSIKH